MGWLQSGSEGMKDIKLQKLISPTHRSRPRRTDGILHGRIRFNEHSGFSREAWGKKINWTMASKTVAVQVPACSECAHATCRKPATLRCAKCKVANYW